MNKRIIFTLVCLTLFVFLLVGQSIAKIEKENVIGVWLFNDGGDIARDSSGNKNDGTLIGKPKSVAGKFGKALEFDITSGVEINNPDKFEFLTWTYVLWFKCPAGADYPNLIGRQFGNAHGWTVHLDPGGATFRIRIDSDGGMNQVKTVPGPARDSEWHHGAISHDEKNKKLIFYFDGLKGESSYLGNYKNSGGFLKIASPAVGAVNLNGGAIDDVAIFNTILEENDILDIMEKGLEAIIPGIIAVSPEGRLTNTWGNIKGYDK